MRCAVSHRCAFDLVFRDEVVCIRPTRITRDVSVENLLSEMGDDRFLTFLRGVMADRSRDSEKPGPVKLIRDFSRAWYVYNIQTPKPC